ncbi:CP12 carbon metabolic regulator [Synechococcus phage S-SZBM1]|uniref:CP12 carbon metabolic regulator n=1 Tax=Synechococcus phage S-SZBM1 TaxID=2926475 RepID=A0AC61TSH7_9CAUD|nr:CP12 carbon metabolic regulator [Synechococcus phage S-SZBM1]UNH61181.1 CP12 carbon metabolic regulator [Synechococcus phage S-SZBM1]
MKDINQHILEDKKILDDPTISPQMRRHIEGELQQLESYKENHPNETYDPNPLELFCDENPDAEECRIYED